jgi:predicted nucleotide-binding protein
LNLASLSANWAGSAPSRLLKKGVALPSDIHGVIYIQLDDAGWRLRLAKELKAAGLRIDINRAL